MGRISMSRRLFLGATGLATGIGHVLAGSAMAQEVERTVTEALMKRRSTRSFAPDPIETQTLLALLWAAFGINRPDSGLHTAPSWRGSAETLIYVADAAGVHSYDPATNTLDTILTEDIRAVLSTQPFVRTAPMALILVADLLKMAEAGADAKRIYAHVDTAIVGQNVYLFCAANGLGTCLVGGADAPAISQALGLDATKLVTFVQPVGRPA
ncbi:nitroreductase family protein [Pseudogemmobacter sp. W21_MBD1_M6]|uniref:nitroreductase family protein n=1 Tax=Pseudogemmobacter sp. W21_MBD1_M6 TaxID=3240271 RepID=UPI003F94612D